MAVPMVIIFFTKTEVPHRKRDFYPVPKCVQAAHHCARISEMRAIGAARIGAKDFNLYVTKLTVADGCTAGEVRLFAQQTRRCGAGGRLLPIAPCPNGAWSERTTALRDMARCRCRNDEFLA